MAENLTIAVLSGKGGTGKTMVSVNLAAVATGATYIDCDVEEPNGHLFLKPKVFEEETITIGKPEVDQRRCDGCKICSDACAFKALAVVNKKLLIFPEICHSCGLCYHLCPQGALIEVEQSLGVLSKGYRDDLLVLSAELKIGEPSGVPLIKALINNIKGGITIIDGPPGSGCLVHETIARADFCLLVAEPTRFGEQNLALVHQLVSLMGKPAAVLLNKTTGGANASEEYAKANGLSIIATLPWDGQLARTTSSGDLAIDGSEHYRQYFSHLLAQIVEEARRA
ncbi:MAG: 4Fe-4S binding protein [Sphaerochaeta sp.]|nr:4Fe-4S binding protein [Sphaerochaeta sp.]